MSDSMEGHDPGSRERCESLSRRMEWSFVVFAVVGAFFTGWLVYLCGLENRDGRGILAVLGLIWLLWLSMLRTNAQLVACGSQSERFGLSPRFVNRPDAAVRLLYHFLVNWAAIALAILAGFAIRPSATTAYLGYACLAATLVVWIGFNVQHRRADRAKNLVLTSTIAALLLIGSMQLIL